MHCKFCKEDKKLIKAHVIPEAFFRKLRSGDKAPILVSDLPDTYPQKSPIGVYDNELVCIDCESLFGVWDEYGQSFLLNTRKREKLMNNGSVLADIVRDIDYSKLKLFFISILWRASASSNNFFSKVQLGIFEEECKTMILEKNPGEANEFSVNISRYIDPAGEVIVEPYPERWYGINYYRFSFAGHMASIKVDNRNSIKHMKGLMLKKDSPIFIPYKDIYNSEDTELILKTINKVIF